MKTAADPDSFASPDPEETPEEKQRGFLRMIGELPGLIILAFVIALLLKTFLIQAFYIPSGSMEPTLQGPGDRILVQKISYYFHDPQRGDIIVFEDPNPTTQPDRSLVGGFLHWMFQGLGGKPDNEDFVKRVIGLPGDTVWAQGGSVYVNGDKLDEPYLTQQTADFPHTEVPAGSLFVMGDNRSNSRDSRFGLGFVPEDKVIGKAWVIIWPPSRMGTIH
ncbi:MAG: signal peptidase I [Actinomycetota bacterium]|nr:signal peptidase I [Actinomycetota bacterium]